jgi:transposase
MVGFDVAKKTIVQSVCDSDYQVVSKPETIINDETTLESSLDKLRLTYDQMGVPMEVCCESTGYYHYSVVRACASLNIPCQVLNPIVTKQAIKATIRGKKTDASDSIVIAKPGLRGEGIYTTNVDNTTKVLLRVSDKLLAAKHGLLLVERSMTERGVAPPEGSTRLHQACLDTLGALITLYRSEAIAKTPRATLDLLTSITGVGLRT